MLLLTIVLLARLIKTPAAVISLICFTSRRGSGHLPLRWTTSTPRLWGRLPRREPITHLGFQAKSIWEICFRTQCRYSMSLETIIQSCSNTSLIWEIRFPNISSLWALQHRSSPVGLTTTGGPFSPIHRLFCLITSRGILLL